MEYRPGSAPCCYSTTEGEPELYPRHQGQPIILHYSNPFCTVTSLSKLFQHVYRLCNSTNLQMHGKYMKQNCWPHNIMGNKSDVFIEISSVTNSRYVRICIGTIMDYPVQFSM